jgi:DME family drug/metabolite transporter
MRVNDTFWRGLAYCVTAALAWALLGPVSRICFAEGMEPSSVAFWRMLISGICFTVHALVSGGLRPGRRDLGCMIFFGAVFVTAFIICFQVSVQKSGSALAIILLCSAPAWVALFSRIIFGETINRTRLAALFLTMAGTVLVCLSGGSLGGEVSWIGIGCGLLCGFTYAFQFLFFTWWKDRYSTQALFAMTFLPAAAVLFFFTDFRPVTLAGAAGVLVLSFVSSYAAYYWYGQALRYLSPVQAAIIGNVEPVVGTWLSWWFWNEDFTAAGWLGCVLVLASILMLAVRK